MLSCWYIALDPVGSLLCALLVIGLSGLPGLLIRRPGTGQLIAVLLTISAAVWGATGAVRILAGAPAAAYLIDWPLPFDACILSADSLSALFLLPLLLAAACCALYGRAYLSAAAQPLRERQVTFFTGLLLAAMGLVLMARNGVLLLVVWEVMALSSWMLLMTDQRDAAVQRAGTVYLLATHAGSLVLYLLFLLLRNQTGSFVFPVSHSLAGGSAVTGVMLLAALIGFGAKAGIMPLHIWLPGTHANAPSHISALMSGIMLKVGLYGVIRTAAFFQQLPAWFGWLVLLLGAISALVGIVLASAQRDLKRLLACSSIENIGIICIGLGMALVGIQSHDRILVVFGLTGAFLHMLNHALFKPLLFLGSGAIIHATGTRQIDRMGGLAAVLPRTAPLFLVGTLAICGLPPLNGFVGELFLYFGAFSDTLYSSLPMIAFIAPVLALVGSLAVLTFVKLYGTMFLGVPRDPTLPPGHEAPWPMLLPMAVLAGLCLLAGIDAPLLLQLVRPVVTDYAAVPPLLFVQVIDAVPLRQLAWFNGALLGCLLLIWLVWRQLVLHNPVSTASTWGCGYLAPTRRMQYTGSSFAAFAVGLFAGGAGQSVSPLKSAGLFPTTTHLLPQTGEFILNRLLIPLLQGIDWCLAWLRRVQSGHLHLYMLYIFITLFLMMVWSRP